MRVQIRRSLTVTSNDDTQDMDYEIDVEVGRADLENVFSAGIASTESGPISDDPLEVLAMSMIGKLMDAIGMPKTSDMKKEAE